MTRAAVARAGTVAARAANAGPDPTERAMNFRRTKDADPGQVVIARYLAANGPTAGDDLAAAVGVSPERFWVLINHPWFEITGKGWDLTDQGRDEGLGGAE